MTTGAWHVEVEGLADFRRDLGRMDRKLRTEWDREMRVPGELVRETAQQIAEYRRLRDSGALIRGLRVAQGRRGSVVVRSTAARRGFAYPSVYEYGGRRSQAVGPRAFLAPALELRRDEVVEAVGEIVDRLASESGLRLGG